MLRLRNDVHPPRPLTDLCRGWIFPTLILIFFCPLLAAQSVTLQWDPNSESDLAGYNIYRSGNSGWGYTKLNSGLITTTTYVDGAVSPGQTYYYVCTAVNTSGAESGYSNEVSATIPSINHNPVANPDAVTTPKNVGVQIAVLANDTDPDGDALTLASVGSASFGTVSKNGNIAVYLPQSNFAGVDTFTYAVSDGRGGSATGTVTVTVVAPNTVPVATNDTASVAAGGSVTINVTSNDSDADGDPLTVTAVGTPSHGTATIVSASSVRYVPNSGYSGSDSFTYTVSDGRGGTASATVQITVIPPNSPPVASSDTVSVAEDGTVTLNVLANDQDPDGDPLTVTAIGQPSHGSAAQVSGSHVQYTPAPNYNGPDSFTYTVSDGKGGSATGTVQVTVTPVNDPPVAQPDTATVAEDGSVVINVIANDTDVDGNSLSVTVVGQPAHGSATKLSSSSVQYVPAANYNGPDSFTYTISDGNGGTATAVVQVTVTAVNDVPVAANDSLTLAEDSSATINVTANDSDADGDTLTVSSVGPAGHGTTSKISATSVRYVPAPNYHGTDSFTYTITDGKGGSATGTISVTVTPVNDPPVAINDAWTVPQGGSVTINPAANDTDVDGDALVVTAFGQPQHGTTTSLSSVSIAYTPAAGFSGTDAFTYTVSDGKGGTATGTVSITVIDTNGSPVANNDTAVTNEDSPIQIAVLANDSDPDGDPLTIQQVLPAQNGQVVIVGGSAVRYSPNPNFHGTDSFTYVAADPGGKTDSATVQVTVTPVNDPPVANADTASVPRNGSVTINVVANDTDLEGDPLTVSAVGTPAHGTAFRLSSTSVQYVAATNYTGPDSFTYTVSDGKGGVATAIVSITVTQANSAPIALNDTATVVEDGTLTISVLANDSDPDGDPLTVTSVSQALNGSLSIVSGNAVRYTPRADYHGADNFTYTISDGALTATAAVSIQVTPVNDPPEAVDDQAQTIPGQQIQLKVLANDRDRDGDTLTLTGLEQPANGQAVFTPQGIVTYTPKPGFEGTDQFQYHIADGAGGSASGRVQVSVASQGNRSPSAVDDEVSIDEDSSGEILPLANDRDPDGDRLNLDSFGQPTHGQVVRLDQSTLWYTPEPDFNGSDSFSYTISDGKGGYANGTVRIRVRPVNDAPRPVDDEFTAPRNTAVEIDVTTNDQEVDGESLTVVTVGKPRHGSAELLSDGRIRFSPRPSFVGNDEFSYTVADSSGARADAVVQVAVVEAARKVRKLIFPATLNTGNALLEDTYVGVGLLNMEAEAAQIGIAARDVQGVRLGDRVLPEPLSPFGQTAFLTNEVLTGSLPNATMEAESSNDALRGLLMVGDFASRRLDGVGALPEASQQLYFSEIRHRSGESTILQLINPDSERSAQLTFELRDAKGALIDRVRPTLSPAGAFIGAIDEIFRLKAPAVDGYVRVLSSIPVQGYGFVASENALTAASGRPPAAIHRLVAPHFFVDSEGGTTTLRILNPGSKEVRATARVRDNLGGEVASVPIRLAPGSLSVIDAGEILGRFRTLVSGSFELEAENDEAPELLATLSFAGPEGRSLTSVPVMHDAGYTDVVFPQVAQTADGRIFTGLAVYNPSATAVEVQVEAFDEHGNLTATTSFELGPYARRTDILATETFFGPQFQQVKGHLRVKATRGVAAYAIFGDLAGSFLSSIEGQPAVE